jgi:LysR family transcriptional regulator, regulator for genes of the gallate degradation pathway
MFHRQGVQPPKVSIECGSMLIARGLLLNGEWLTRMSRDQIQLERRAGVLPRSKLPVKSCAGASS